MANDFWGSITEWFKEKTSSPLYGVFIISYVVCNWKKFYVLFWEFGAPSSGTRLEFLNNNILPFNGSGLWLYPSVLANWVSGLIAPVIITIIIIKYAPYFEKWAHNLHLDFYFERKKNSKIKEQDYEEFFSAHLKNVVLEKEKQVASAQSVEGLTEQINSLLSQVTELQGKQEHELITPEERRWGEEFDTGRKNLLQVSSLQKAKEAIYRRSGAVSTENMGRIVGPDELAFLDSHGLVTFLDGNTISFTPKGKFFLKQAFQEKT